MSPSIQVVQQAASSLQTADLSWAAALIEKLEGNPQAVDEFSKGPEAYIRAMGYALPAEFHVHFIDASGTIIPAETTQGNSWSGARMEARFSNGRVAAALCVYCPDNHGSCFS
ncbi:hypothetical protein GO286_04850 [Ralstonia solanacearum]|nr:hypothetical protein [Ralstonia solanacearum]